MTKTREETLTRALDALLRSSHPSKDAVADALIGLVATPEATSDAMHRRLMVELVRLKLPMEVLLALTA